MQIRTNTFPIQTIEMYCKSLKNSEKIFAVAPMMDWTDRHCRFFHRLMTRRALLYTEMVVAEAIVFGDAARLLSGDQTRGPLALQLGGADPERLAAAVRLALPFGYDEFNLNVGCPSDRVQSGVFGACLMREPVLVGRAVAAMKAAAGGVPVTVKCRIGVDDQDSGPALDALADAVWGNGCDGLWVHARKAWLDGLSPKENRELPPLDYERVRRLKADNPGRFVGLNGGLQDIDQALAETAGVEVPLDGAMLGRAAYQRPALLRAVDRRFYGEPAPLPGFDEIIAAMADYAEDHLAAGGKLHHVTRHMIGLFHGLAGARRWRQILSSEVQRPGVGAEVLVEAFRAVDLETAEIAA